MTARNENPSFDPILLAVLSRRLEAIIREMSNTVMRASRSAVITNARDMSCGILTYDHRLICVEEAMPIHVSALDLTTRPITELFDDVKEGDAFFNNSPYLGVTHHADMTCRTAGIRGKGLLPVMAGAAVFTLVQRLHGKVLLFFCRADLHFKNLAMAVRAVQTSFNVHAVIKNHGLDRLAEHNGLGGIVT